MDRGQAVTSWLCSREGGMESHQGGSLMMATQVAAAEGEGIGGGNGGTGRAKGMTQVAKDAGLSRES
jgi:DNA-binding phage protein